MLVMLVLLGTAQDVAQPKDAEGLSGSVELTAANATGNTENLAIGLSASLDYETDRFEHNFDTGLRYAETGAPGGEGERVETQDQWFAAYKLDAELSEKTFAYLRTRYEEDQFSGFERRIFAGGGLGRRIFESDTLNWTVNGGPGVRYAEVRPDAGMMQQRQDGTELAGSASSEFAWDLSDDVGVTHEADVVYGEANTTLTSEAGVQSALTETLAMRVSFRVTHETEPPAGRQATDTLTRIGLTVDF